MRKTAFVLGITGVSIFVLRLIWTTTMLIQQFFFTATKLSVTNDSISTDFAPSFRYIINSLFILLIQLAIAAFAVLFILTLLRFLKRKPIKTFVIITLLILSCINIISIIPPQMTVIPNYITISKLGLLDTYIPLIVSAVLSITPPILMIISLIMMLTVTKREAFWLKKYISENSPPNNPEGQENK